VQLTNAALAEQRKGILERRSAPAFLAKVLGEEREHLLLFWMPGCLSPEVLHQAMLAESVVEETALDRITVVARHVLSARHLLRHGA
jgi:hypothetical protein